MSACRHEIHRAICVEPIESVYMPGGDNRRTLCISTQVGCRFRCSICLTGELGLKRNLRAEEILHQIDLVALDHYDFLACQISKTAGKNLGW